MNNLYTDGVEVKTLHQLKRDIPGLIANNGADLSHLGWFFVSCPPQPVSTAYTFTRGAPIKEDDGYRVEWEKTPIPLQEVKSSKLIALDVAFSAVIANGFSFNDKPIALVEKFFYDIAPLARSGGRYLLEDGTTVDAIALLTAADTHVKRCTEAKIKSAEVILAVDNLDTLDMLFREFPSSLVDWEPSKIYAEGDVVFHDGLFFKALADVTLGIEPDLVYDPAAMTGGWKPM